MSDYSESFRPIKVDYDDTQSFSHPELLYTTSGAKLYRARKAGIFFMLKTPIENRGMYIELLKREYELSIGFSHPHIINVFTYEPNTEVGPAIVMEYIDGRNLAEYLKEEPALSSRIRIFEQLLSAISCLHKADIIHNDLKPQNILITRANDDVKLIDFGLSDNSAYYLMKQLGCTPRYASPELLSRTEATDARSDIYSIGCLMRDLFGERYKAIRKRCLQSFREDRYDNVEALLLAWQHRKLPQRILPGLVLATSIIIPSVLYVSEHRNLSLLEQATEHQIKQYDSITHSLRQQIKNTQDELAKRKHTVDSINLQYDKNVKKRYQQAKEELAKIPFKEFSFRPVTDFNRYSWNLETSYTQEIQDPSIHSQLTSHFDALRNNLQTQLYDIVGSKPTIDPKKMSEKEYLYYISLITANEDYQKYQP